MTFTDTGIDPDVCMMVEIVLSVILGRMEITGNEGSQRECVLYVCDYLHRVDGACLGARPLTASRQTLPHRSAIVSNSCTSKPTGQPRPLGICLTRLGTSDYPPSEKSFTSWGEGTDCAAVGKAADQALQVLLA